MDNDNTIVVPTEFDYSMLSTFQTCQRRYYYRYVRHLTTLRRCTPLEFGKAIHRGLDVWFDTRDLQQALTAFQEVWEEAGGDWEEDALRTLEKGKKVIKGYAERYAQEPFEVIDIEVPFEVVLADLELVFIGRMDKVIKWDGAIGPMDHKTTSSLGFSSFKAYNPNLQFDGYMYACSKLYDSNCYWAVPDLIQVAKTKMEFARNKETRSSAQIAEFPELFGRIAKEAQRCHAEGFLPNYSMCTYYGECPYRNICKEAPSVQERIIEIDYAVEKWDPRGDTDTEGIKRVTV